MALAALLTTFAAWIGAATGVAALALVLRARPRAPPRTRPRLAMTVARASHERRGPDSIVRVALELRNDGDAAARVHVAEAEVDAIRSGAAGLKQGRATASAPLEVAVAPGDVARANLVFEFRDALLPDGELPLVVRAVHERGSAEAHGATRR
ncbi:MAG TPA: hypothetical protein VI997_08615 [Candidatus Thermoplasmatota archaeon]|nr:hypothetical protein [Candidatus Thermoplasmatota archaeon]